MLEFWEMISYIVTSISLPAAVVGYLMEKRKERRSDEVQVFESLNSSYEDFLSLVISNPDLQLRSRHSTPGLTPEQQDRITAIFEMLISVFERAYFYMHDEAASGRRTQHLRFWEDFVRQWCRREDFRSRLPELLVSDDSEFSRYIRRIAAEESRELEGR